MRRQNDRYFTPEFATQELYRRVGIAGRVLECCAGDGAIAKVLRRAEERTVYCNDIVGNCDFALDVAREEAWRSLSQGLGGIDWVVTNPPFSMAAQIVPLAFQYAQVGIAMLLRKTYTEPCFDRSGWLLAYKGNFANQIFLPRISFTGDGKSDNVACDWYVWTKQKVLGCTVDWVLK